MVQKLIIKEKLPSFNEYNNTSRHNPYAANKLKQQTQALITCHINNAGLKPCNGIVDIDFVWQEKDRRRDPDNIYSAKKFILDALVKSKVLKDDGQRFVGNFTDTLVKGENYGVMVLIKERA